MHKLTIPFLIAGSEMLEKIMNLMPKLAHQIGVPVQELFYFWMSSRRAKTWEYFIHASKTEMEKYGQGIIENTNWKYFFHGFECDLDHMKDGRHLRIEFGPKGRIDTFSGFAVMEYIMASKPPWPEYKELKEFLVSPEYPSGSFDKMCILASELSSHKFVETADPELAKLVKKYTKIRFRRMRPTQVLKLPRNTTNHEWNDAMVCGRGIISAKGKDQITKHRK